MTERIDYRATLLAQYEALRKFPMFQVMADTVEASPWHREPNVLAHTDMVVNEYVRMIDQRVTFELGELWNHQTYLGGIAAVFHDVGKPAAEIQKFSEARGNYRAYHGHELLSARMFETYAVQRFPMFSALDIFTVCWMIEHHMPWNIEDKTKLTHMAMTAKWIGAEAFCIELLADQFGRIADDQSSKNAKAQAWVDKFAIMTETIKMPTPQMHPDYWVPTIYMPIAPSGAGKSTFLKILQEQNPTLHVFSLDLLRHEFYDASDYALAYAGSVNDKSFNARANARFLSDVKSCIDTKCDLYVDNTNLSARRRKSYLDVVRKYNFKAIAITMPAALDVLLARQKTRGDKVVPDSAVQQQYQSLQLPMLGEFDQIITSDHNMRK